MRTLLELLNRSWCSGVVPAAWRTATIIPIIKKNKPPNAFKSYRPVSLLSCISKTLERMVMNRIYHWQRQHSLIPSTQAGFQAGRSTTDCIAQLTQHAMNALQERVQRTLQVAIDLSTAFDRVWRARLLADLAEGGMPSLWLRWLRNWLSDRRAQVRWIDATSRTRVFSAGVPQGSPLSPLLFSFYTSSLLREIERHPAFKR